MIRVADTLTACRRPAAMAILSNRDGPVMSIPARHEQSLSALKLEAKDRKRLFSFRNSGFGMTRHEMNAHATEVQ